MIGIMGQQNSRPIYNKRKLYWEPGLENYLVFSLSGIVLPCCLHMCLGFETLFIV